MDGETAARVELSATLGPPSVCVVDAAGRVEGVTGALRSVAGGPQVGERLDGWTLPEALLQAVRAVAEGRRTEATGVWRVGAGAPVWRVHAVGLQPSGAVVHVGAPAAWARLMDAVDAAGRGAALGGMTSTLYHDVNNLLTVVLGNLEGAATAPDLPVALRAALGRSAGAARQAAELIHGLSAWRTGRGVDVVGQTLGELVRVRLPLWATVGRGRVTLDEQDRVVAAGPPERVEQAVGHLVLNAVLAAGPGGHTEVVVAADGPDHAVVRVAALPTGEGVASVLGEVGGTLTPGRAGLGGPLAVALAAELSGTVSVGAEGVSLRLPTRLPGLGATGPDVLVVVGHPGVRDLLVAWAEAAGAARVVGVGTADAARAVGGPRVLVVDLDLPDSDGLSLAAAVASERPSVRVLLTSGRLASLPRRPALAAHQWRFLARPFAPGAVLEVLSEWV